MPGAQPPVDAQALGEVLDFMRLLWGLDHSLQSASKRMNTTLGITGPQRLVVRLVGRFPGISAGKLAELQRVHPSTLTGVIARLEERGIITRKADPADHRRVHLHLTRKGVEVDSQRAGTVEAKVRRALARLDPAEIEAARRVLRLLEQEISGESGTNAPPA